ncbi:MAG: tetratricopeptide (TPR) repeat protein [Gammaproteobacteria bacterium]|jgi:tetratricopeptide (TPR) repeat protein
MRIFSHLPLFALSGLMIISFSVQAEINTEIQQVQKEWARIKYTIEKKQHESALKNLALKATSIRMLQPDNADAHLWEGIVLSTYGGAIGTLRALDAVTKSRDALEKSLKIDPEASKGAANTYLGTLYVLVPEWPIGFGDLDLAKQYLDKAIMLNPDDIDANLYYGDFLKKKKKYKQAEVFYKKALSAPARPGREVADEGRRNEAKERLAEILVKSK